jgi:hypothetical protein
MKYKLNENVAINDLGVLFNIQSGDSFVLNDFGRIILDQIRKELTLEELKEFVLLNYEVEKVTMDEHLEEFISYMLRQQLIIQY